MNCDPTPAGPPAIEQPAVPGGGVEFRGFKILTLVLTGLFAVPIYRLVRYALESGSLYSHAILIPFVSAYLVWINRKSLSQPAGRSIAAAILFGLAGAGLLGIWLVLDHSGKELIRDDYLALTIGSYYCFFVAVTLFSLGWRFCRQILFPLAFLVFIVPFPEAMTTALENLSKHASAETYAFLMNLCGASYHRQGLVFALPGLTIEVAQECSGIRSSLVLFITSLVAGYMFLSRPRNRAILALVILPLGVLRNAFRILVLSLLTIHWDPRVIDSPLHHRGGPLFFLLSLAPFLILLLCLAKTEKKKNPVLKYA